MGNAKLNSLQQAIMTDYKAKYSDIWSKAVEYTSTHEIYNKYLVFAYLLAGEPCEVKIVVEGVLIESISYLDKERTLNITFV